METFKEITSKEAIEFLLKKQSNFFYQGIIAVENQVFQKHSDGLSMMNSKQYALLVNLLLLLRVKEFAVKNTLQMYMN